MQDYIIVHLDSFIYCDDFFIDSFKKMNNFLDVLNTFTGVLPPNIPPEVPKDYDGRIPNDTSLMKNQPLQLGQATGDNYTYALDTSASDEFFKFGRKGSRSAKKGSKKRSAKKSSRNYLLTTKKRMPRLSKRKTKQTKRTRKGTKRRVSHKKTSFGRKRRTVHRKKYLFGSDMNATKAPVSSSGNGLEAPYFGGSDYFNRPPEWFLPISNNKLQIPNFKPF
jgi:hypothetical protein